MPISFLRVVFRWTYAWVSPYCPRNFFTAVSIEVNIRSGPSALAQRRALHHREHLGLHGAEPHFDAGGAAARLGLDEHLERGVFEVEYRAQVEHQHARLVLGHAATRSFSTDTLGVEEEQPAFQPREQQARLELVVRMSGERGRNLVVPGSRPSTYTAGFAAWYPSATSETMMADQDALAACPAPSRPAWRPPPR